VSVSFECKLELSFLRHQKGSSPKNLVDGKQDLSDWNTVKNNYFGPNIAAEHIDVKEGTSHGVIFNNKFDGTGQTGENSSNKIINLKGGNYKVHNNEAFNLKYDGVAVRYMLKYSDFLLSCFLNVCFLR
jgi:hypothetical protein